MSKKAKDNQGNRNDLTSCSNEQKVNTRKEVAKAIDMSESTYSRHKFVYDNADEETIKNLDEGKLSVNKVYSELKNKAKELENKTKSLEQEKLRLQSELNNER